MIHIDNLKESYAIFLKKEKLEIVDHYILHIALLQEAINQKLKAIEILIQNNHGRSNLQILSNIWLDFINKWKNLVNGSGKEKNKITFMKVMLDQYFKFFEAIIDIPYENLSDVKILQIKEQIDRE